jgi:para-nitrobenzyl esterase
VSAYPDAKSAFVAATSDAVFVCPARTLARAMAKAQKEPVYRYFFSYAPDDLRHAAHGASHGAELLFVFDHLRPLGHVPTANEQLLAHAVTDYWTRFADTGDPNGPGNIPWPRYDAKTDPHVVLDTPVAPQSGLHTANCDFWDGVPIGD